jgi:hypothetical protein
MIIEKKQLKAGGLQVKFKTFRETDKRYVEDELNNFFVNKNVEIIKMNSCVERVGGIDYLTTIVCYKDLKSY